MSKEQPATSDLDKHFTSTYSRISLSEWKPIVNIIRLHSKFIKELSQEQHKKAEEELQTKEEESSFTYEDFEEEEEKSEFELELEADFASTFAHEFKEEEEEEEDILPEESLTSEKLPPLISPIQIKTTFEGPYQNFLKLMITTYAKNARIRFEKHLLQEEIFKGNRISLVKNQITSQKLEKINFSDLNQIEEKLNQMTNDFHQKWQEFYSEAAQNFIEHCKKENILLTTYEKKEIHDEEPFSELTAKFIELNLTLPEYKSPLTFTQYLSMKIHLTLQSALSRQHLPHGNTEINEILKKFKPNFNKMSKQEKQLFNKQQDQVNEVIKSLVNLF